MSRHSRPQGPTAEPAPEPPQSPAPEPRIKRIRPLIIAVIVVAAILIGHAVRARLGIEFSPESIRLWVEGLGWKAPAIYIALVTFRHFMFLSTIIIVPAGGICFGTAAGTGLALVGIVISGLMQFGLARGFGRAWVRGRLGKRMRRFERRVETAGAMLVGLVTAHPTAPMTPFHWAAGISSMSVAAFAAALAAGGLVRAFSLSFFGATLLEPWSPLFYAATALLAALILIPIIHPGLRRRMFGPVSGPDDQSVSDIEDIDRR